MLLGPPLAQLLSLESTWFMNSKMGQLSVKPLESINEQQNMDFQEIGANQENVKSKNNALKTNQKVHALSFFSLSFAFFTFSFGQPVMI